MEFLDKFLRKKESSPSHEEIRNILLKLRETCKNFSRSIKPEEVENRVGSQYKAKLLLAGFLILPFIADAVLAILTGYSESSIILGALLSDYPFLLIIIVPILFIWGPYFWISGYFLSILSGIPEGLLYKTEIIGPISLVGIIYMLSPIYAYLSASIIIYVLTTLLRGIRNASL